MHQDSLWGRPERINELIASADETLTLAEDIGDKERASEARVWRLLCSLELGNIQAVDTELEALRRLAEEMRQPLYVYLSIGYQAMRALLEGRFADAERLAQQGLAVGQRMQGEDPSGIFGLQMFTIRREQGRLREVEPAVRIFVQQNPAALTWQPGLAVVYSELGLEQEAREMFERLAVNGFADIPRDSMWVTSMTYLAEVCAFLGDARRAAMLYQRLLPYAEHNVIVGNAIACTGAAARYLGMLATTMSRWAEAETTFPGGPRDERQNACQTLPGPHPTAVCRNAAEPRSARRPQHGAVAAGRGAGQRQSAGDGSAHRSCPGRQAEGPGHRLGEH